MLNVIIDIFRVHTTAAKVVPTEKSASTLNNVGVGESRTRVSVCEIPLIKGISHMCEILLVREFRTESWYYRATRIDVRVYGINVRVCGIGVRVCGIVVRIYQSGMAME